MEPQQPHLEPTMPESPSVSNGSPQPTLPKTNLTGVPLMRSPWAIGGGVIIIGIFILLGIRRLMQKPALVVVPTPTPTATSTPTPIRQRSPFATTSAFMTLDNAVASYATAVKAYNVSDPSLSPPVLDLNLGF